MIYFSEKSPTFPSEAVKTGLKSSFPWISYLDQDNMTKRQSSSKLRR